MNLILNSQEDFGALLLKTLAASMIQAFPQKNSLENKYTHDSIGPV